MKKRCRSSAGRLSGEGGAARVASPRNARISCRQSDSAICPQNQETVIQAAPGDPQCEGLADANKGGNVRKLGFLVFIDYVFPFEATAVLLVVAAIGAMVFGRRREDPADLAERPIGQEDEQ